MKEENNNRNRWLHVRLTKEEYGKIHKEFSRTNSRKLSEYARKILLGKPMVSTFRNRSHDDLMTEAVRLRNELNNIGNNFNQAVKKLHTLHQIQDFKNWIYAYESDEKKLLDKVEEIKNHIQKIAEQWLQ